MRRELVTILVLLSSPACGRDEDRPAVDPEQPISDLDSDESSTLCEWAIDRQGGSQRSIECDGFTVGTGSVATCTADLATAARCSPLLVRDVVACIELLAEDPCRGSVAEPCAEWLRCVRGQS